MLQIVLSGRTKHNAIIQRNWSGLTSYRTQSEFCTHFSGPSSGGGGTDSPHQGAKYPEGPFFPTADWRSVQNSAPFKRLFTFHFS